MTIQLRRGLLVAEAGILFLLSYFFWHISSFPYDRADTGIIRAEWDWVVLLVGLVLSVYVIAQLSVWRRWPVWVRVGGSIALWMLIPLIIVLVPAFADASNAVDRKDWFWLLAALLPFYGVRLLRIQQRQQGRPIWMWVTPWMVAFLLLCGLAVLVTPDITGYPTRGWGMLARPVLGMAWVIFFMDVVRVTGRLNSLLHIFIALGLLLGYYALTATQWDLSKSGFFEGGILWLDNLPDLTLFATLNPNEVAGVMVWLLPVVALAVAYPLHTVWRILAGIATVMLVMALLFGQSRSALLGLGGASVLVVGGLSLAGRVRAWVVAAVAAVIFVVVVGSLFLLQGGGLSQRDQATASERFAYWDSAFDMIGDYPLTGVGMNMYRDFSFPNPQTGRTVRDDYPVIAENPYPPHTHNEFIQIATDLGLPGLVVWVGLYLVAGAIAWRIWTVGIGWERWVAGALASGLIAHAIYGMTDAIPVWDRFAFVFWMVYGGLAAVSVLVFGRKPKNK